MNITNSIKSSAFLGVIVGLFAFSALLGVFGLGEFVGSRMNGPFTHMHGTAGTVMRIDGNALIVNGRDRGEHIIITDPMDMHNIRANDHVVIIGEPNEQGEIMARFIRILP